MDIGVILQVLWPYLAVLYLLDCFVHVRGGHLLLSGAGPAGFRLKTAGLRLTGLLPRDWSVLTDRELPLFSEKGVYVRLAPDASDPRPPCPDDLEFIPFEDMRNISRGGRKILVNGKVLHIASTVVAAAVIENRLKAVAGASPGERPGLLKDFITAATDVEAAEAEIEEIRRSSILLTRVSTGLFVLTFLFLPASLILRVPQPWLWLELIMMGAACLFSLVLWSRLHRTYLPDETGDRMEELLVFAFFPVSLMHSFGKLTRRLFASYDSVAITVALEPALGVEILGRELIWTRAAAEAAADAGEDLRSVWNMRIRSLERVVRDLDNQSIQLKELKEISGENGEPFCPLCLATYREEIAECADCRVPLRTDAYQGGDTGTSFNNAVLHTSAGCG